MPKISVIVDNDIHLKILKIKMQLSKENPSKNIDFSDAVRFVLKKGLEK